MTASALSVRAPKQSIHMDQTRAIFVWFAEVFFGELRTLTITFKSTAFVPAALRIQTGEPLLSELFARTARPSH